MFDLLDPITSKVHREIINILILVFTEFIDEYAKLSGESQFSGYIMKEAINKLIKKKQIKARNIDIAKHIEEHPEYKIILQQIRKDQKDKNRDNNNGI